MKRSSGGKFRSNLWDYVEDEVRLGKLLLLIYSFTLIIFYLVFVVP